MEKYKIIEKFSNIISQKWDGNVLGVVIAGSCSYGLSTNASDVDLRAVHAVSGDYLLGLSQLSSSNSTIEISEGITELVSHEVGKFLNLCINGNPAVIELLYTPQNNILLSSDFFDKIREPEIRNSFINEDKIVSSYFGYSKSQLIRMTSQIIKAENIIKAQNIKFSDPLTISQILIDNPYLNSEFKYNYKLASHCLRLLVAVNKFMINGELSVHTEDAAKELLEYKNGLYPYGQFLLKVYNLLNEINKNKENSKIPKQFNKDVINNILIDYRKQLIK